MVDVDVYATGFLDVSQALLDNRQRDKSQEVHLNQSYGLYHMSVIFGDQHAFLAVLVFYRTQRGKIGQIIGSDDHAASVYTHLTNRSFQPRGIFEHRAGIGISLAMKYNVIHIETAFAEEWQADVFNQQICELGVDTIDAADYYIPSELWAENADAIEALCAASYSCSQ